MNSESVKILNDTQELVIDLVTPEDEGIYRCEASNNYIKTQNFETLYISDKYNWLYAQITLIIIAFIFILQLVVLKRYRDRNLQSELSSLGLVYFQKGAMQNINPNLSIDEQADLLLYEKKWEIPSNNIELGKQLGSGAFGVIFEGKILSENKTVAIKTTNPNSGFECVRFLASELKIMAYLGGHINVVNLLGASTRNIGKRGLLVVLEFCQFGNLRHYVQRRRNNFLDQKNYDTDEFDWDKGKLLIDVNEESSSICSRDLLIWSFQISEGMKFLNSRRIVHGDLAARNILLADNNVAKISDFGLARKMYQYTQYVKRKEGPLPVKWMSLEAIERGHFSTESDVWSYGIILWEMFSLGKTPYPGMVFDNTFYKLLKDGYRMESPETATTKIYEIMKECWDADPTQRPSFTKLSETIGSFLEEETVHHYLSMNDEYMIMSDPQQDDYQVMANFPGYINSILGYLKMSRSTDS